MNGQKQKDKTINDLAALFDKDLSQATIDPFIEHVRKHYDDDIKTVLIAERDRGKPIDRVEYSRLTTGKHYGKINLDASKNTATLIK